MLIVDWDKELETGIELMDNQHRDFIIKCNDFYVKTIYRRDMEDCRELLKYLEWFLLYHFQVEEAFQKQLEYPEYRSHQAMHDRIKIKVKQIIVMFDEKGLTDESLQAFLTLNERWITEHMMVEDKKFSIFYRKYIEDNQLNTDKK